MNKITPHHVDPLATTIANLIDQIEADQNLPITPGQTAYRGGCKDHPNATFPLRATMTGAQEDKISHGSTPGSHWLLMHEEIAPEATTAAEHVQEAPAGVPQHSWPHAQANVAQTAQAFRGPTL